MKDLLEQMRLSPLSRIRLWIALGCALILGSVPIAQSAELTIDSEFKPDSSKPQHNVFVNKTPNSGEFCKIWPTTCVQRGVHSLGAKIRFNSVTPVVANHTDPRQGAMVKTPTEWRSISVTNSQTLEVENLEIRISGFGSSIGTYPQTVHDLVPDAASWLDGHNKLWSGGNWAKPPPPCIALGTSSGYWGHYFTFFWEIPPGTSICAKQALYNIPTLYLEPLDFFYELKTPNPLGMSSGEYNGSITYTVGPHQDFDMGDILIPNSSTLKLNFNLKVEHTLKVEIPPDGNQVELTPKTGWQQWLQNNRTPEKFYHDQRFLISSSSRLKMNMQCSRTIGNTCALTNNNHEVPMDIFLTLPSGLRREDGSVANRQPLLVNGVGTEKFQPLNYVDRHPALLHFEVQKIYVHEMLLNQGKYTGNVVVIWDSKI